MEQRGRISVFPIFRDRFFAKFRIEILKKFTLGIVLCSFGKIVFQKKAPKKLILLVDSPIRPLAPPPPLGLGDKRIPDPLL